VVRAVLAEVAAEHVHTGGQSRFALQSGSGHAEDNIRLRLLSWRYGNLAFRRPWQYPGGIGEGAPTYRISIRTQKKAERNSQWHQTPLLTEKRFQAANRSWTKRQLQAVVTFFIGRLVQNPSYSCWAVRLDNAIPNWFC
jgi:hypothetical protein